MGNADVAVSLKAPVLRPVAPTLRERTLSLVERSHNVGVLSKIIELSPQDQAFCEKHTELIPWLKSLRATETVLQTGVFPDEGQENTDSTTEHLTVCIQTILEHGGFDAVPVVLHDAYTTAHNFYTKSTTSGIIGYLGIVDVYMGSCLGADAMNGDDQYHLEVEKALQPLLYKRGGGSEELIASRFLTYKGYEGYVNMRVIGRPLDTSHAFDYYGARFAIDGLPEGGEYSVSELELGVFGVHDHTKRNNIVNIVNIHPYRVDYRQISDAIHVEAVDPKKLFQHILGRAIPGYADDAEKFLSHYVPFYHEKPYAEGRITRFYDIYERFALSHANANALPLEAKYYLWKNLCELSGSYDEVISPQLYTLLNAYGTDMAWVIQAMNGDKGLLEKLVHTFMKGEQNADVLLGFNPDTDAAQLFQAMARVEQYIVEAAFAVSSSAGDMTGTGIQNRINFLLPLTRGMVREAMETMAKVRSERNGNPGAVMQSFTLGFEQYEKILNILCHLQEKEEVRNVPFDSEQLDRIGRFRSDFPEASITGQIMTTAVLVQALFNQRAIPVEERNAWLRTFYKDVIEKGVYTPEKASVYTDATGLEVARYVNALKTLYTENIPTRDSANNKRFRVLSVGAGDGNRVEGPAYVQLEEEMPEAMPSEVVGLDMFAQDEKTALWHKGKKGNTIYSFIHSDLETVVEKQPDLTESFDCIVIHGSALNNMDLLAVQYQYFATLYKLLRLGGVVMIDTGAIEPAATVNQRFQRTRDFQKLFPESPPGAIEIIPEYLRPTDKPGDIGALIYQFSMLKQLAEDSGFALLGDAGKPEFESQLQGVYQDPHILLEESQQNTDGFLQSIWVANPPDKPEPGMNIRMTLFLQKKEEANANPFVAPFLTARQILVGDSQRGEKIHSEAS